MKNLIKLFSITLPFVLLQQFVLAQNDNNNDNRKKYEFVKSKTINKSYNVSSSDKLSIKNSFGDVQIHTWNRNEIKVDVSVEVSANTESLAQKIVDGIEIDDAKTKIGGDISFRTSIKGVNNSKGQKSTMKVNYEISMPAVNPLHISNEFGATVLPDFKGEVDLTSKFGSLTTGALANVKSVNVEFGKATIESVANGPVSIKFSSAVLGKLLGNVKLNLEFSDATRINLDNSLTALDVKVSYSTLNLQPVGEISASYNISTSFGGFKNRTNIKFESDESGEEKGPKFDFNYNGKSGGGSVPVKIKASFGDVILGEPNADDLKSKGKNKSKKTVTL